METTVQNDRLRMKRFLAQYFNAKRKIRHLEKRLAAVRAELRHPTLGSPPMDGMPHGTSISSGAAAANTKTDRKHTKPPMFPQFQRSVL